MISLVRGYIYAIYCISDLVMVCIGMKRKFRYGIWKMPEWNGMEDFKNEIEDNLPFQFHTGFRSWHLQ